MKHTKLPWIVDIRRQGAPSGAYIRDSKGSIVATIGFGMPDANAEFIVRCVNSYYELVEACKVGRDLAEELLRITGLSTIHHIDVRKAFNMIEQALAKAKKEDKQ